MNVQSFGRSRSLQRRRDRGLEDCEMTNQRSAKWIGGLAAIGLLARTVVASAGVADTPLPNFPASSPAGCAAGCPALAVYYAFGAIKNNGVETDFICTNTTTSIQNIALEVFDETGALRN